MAAKISLTNSTQTFDGPREHAPFRLEARLLAILEDLATGVEAGDAGLKSCALGAVSAGLIVGAEAKEVSHRHHREVEVIEDEDECFNQIGSLVAAGYSFREVADRVELGGGNTHLLALERWCDRVRLGCDADAELATPHASVPWSGSALHERRHRGHRAVALLRQTPEGAAHAAILFIVYGGRDTFAETLPAEIVVALGREFAPLARYTDVVERLRLEMAHREGARAATDANGAVSLAGFRERRDRADRLLTSGDAIRSAVSAFLEPGLVQGGDESRHHWEARIAERKVRRLAHGALVDAFVLQVKVEASRMLTEASVAFRDAWMAS